ncbi:MAG: PstS family phosphate ABC transporter substrate-binding protein [Actinomycetota bacterium]|nr:PstS family phosphate ABC transporter substrate-binding protein [Actinomycetota bacterium]
MPTGPPQRIFAVRPLAVVCLLLLLLAGCGRERPSAEPPPTATDEDPLGGFEEPELTGQIRADGSSTVSPLLSLAAERFRKQEPKVRVTVGTSGTGGGFERFCRGETDLSNASRPIKDEEVELCAKNRVENFPLQVANDGLSIVVNKQNTWASCLTVDQLKKIWEPKSKVDSWRDVDPKFPDEKLTLFGAGTDSGTFDYFTEAIVGEEGASRSDYTPSEDDNVTVRGVSGQKGALGYFGLSYLVENANRVKGLAVDGGEGCIEPTVETVQDGSYKPLSRPLFTYVNEDALAEKPALDPFLTFVLDNANPLARGAKFVPMTSAQVDQAHTALESGGVGVE